MRLRPDTTLEHYCAVLIVSAMDPLQVLTLLVQIRFSPLPEAMNAALSRMRTDSTQAPSKSPKSSLPHPGVCSMSFRVWSGSTRCMMAMICGHPAHIRWVQPTSEENDIVLFCDPPRMNFVVGREGEVLQ